MTDLAFCRLGPLFCCFALLTGCVTSLDDLTEVDEVSLEATYAIPLIDSETDLRELVGDLTDEATSFSIDADGLIRFRYTGNLPGVNSDVIFEQLEALGRGIVIPLTRPRQAAPFVGTTTVFIDELRVSGGSFFYSFPNPYDVPVSVRLTIPEATLGGLPFTVTGDLPAHSGNGPPPVLQNETDPVRLEGYTISVPEDSLYLEYEITGPDGAVLPVPAETVTAFTDLTFGFFRGYLGRDTFPGGRDTIAIDFFDNYLEGDIFFVDPTVTVRLFNTFGVPAWALVPNLNVIDVEGNVIPIEGPAVETGFDFDFPTRVGDTAVTTFVFDNTNSNVAEVLSARPVALDYEINALVNPEADTDLIGFVTDTSTYRAEVDLELPLYGNADNFTVRDTFPLDLMDRFEEIVGVDFRLTTRNGLPLDVVLTGTFIDSTGTVLTDLTEGALTVLNAAPVDGAGNPTGRSERTTDLNFTAERLDAIREANRLVLTLELATTNEGTPLVRLTDRQTLRVLLGATVDVRRP